MTSSAADTRASAIAHAPFLAGLIAREATDWQMLADADDLSVAKRLRVERRCVARDVALGDLSGELDLTAVTRRLTQFADQSLHTAIRTAICERTPGEPAIGFAALALGKQGSFELNYSSDIDPILIYDSATLPCRPREEPADAAVRIARRVLELLQARDADGYVLRVDLRLRPSPEITPLAIPIDAAIAYYESQALPWERAAFIRARAAAGDVALGQRFLDTIRPFIWRRSLDFGAVGEILDITRRIRDHHAQGQAFGPGFDLKRGRGGIREVEFFAQIHQLIHGGRDPALRAPATRDALAALSDAGRIPQADADALADAYTVLRTVEHRVQMIDDRQTHVLPGGEALDHVAQLHGLSDGEALLDLLRPHVARVSAIFDALAPERHSDLPLNASALTDHLRVTGFTDAAGVAARIGEWRDRRYPALRSPASQAALEAVLPALVAALAAAPVPAAAVERLDRIIERLPSAINFFRLLEAQPALTELVARVLSHAPTLAEELARRPDLLDGLLDASALDRVGAVADLARAMRRVEADADYQLLLDHVRRVVSEQRFALGVQLVAAAADPLQIAHDYASVAEAALRVLTDATLAEFARAHGRVPGSELLILALGRFGGGALTHASDLDLIFLFTGDFLAESDGPRPLGATLYYNRLAQRVTAALSVPTSAGPLYKVDTRLRPSGSQGPLAVTLDSFARYQRELAWTWEHMALTRARVVYGSPEARGSLDQVIADVLGGARAERDIVADARAMRAEMAAHKPPQGPLDAKLLPGGLVDLEFATHVVQLVTRSGFSPDLGLALDRLIARGQVPASLREAHDLLTRLLVTARLVAPDAAEPPAAATRALIAQALRLADWDAVLASFAAVREEVARAWRELCDE